MAKEGFEFKSHSEIVIHLMDAKMLAVLEEVAGAIEAQTKRNTKVKTGQTKGSWSYTIKSNNHNHTATIGSTMENAIWEEFGTGKYADGGRGRKGGWFYEDEEGVGHFTHGKKARHPFQHAYDRLKNASIRKLQNAFKGGILD